MLPHLSPAHASALRERFRETGYTPDGVRALLGAGAHDALTRGEPEPAARATRDGGALGTLVRLLLLEGTEPETAVAAALGDLAPLVDGGLLTRTPEGLRAALDIRPYGESAGSGDPGSAGSGDPGSAGDGDPRSDGDGDPRSAGDGDTGADWWVVSDLDTPAARQDRDHVTGVGGASLSLAAATVRRPTGSVLDLGTGCGVQALHASRHAQRVVGTDVAPRALALARMSCLLSDVEVDLREGPWFSPVAGERFDQIVSNPPFVPGPARVDYVYRDSGQAGDTAFAALLADLPGLLNPGGIAQMLGSWLHVRGQDWPDRVRSWIPDGCDAWVLQRETVDPAMHVGTWQRDAGLVPSSPQAREQAATWLDWMESEDVEGVGFGFLLLRRHDRPGLTPTIVVEDLPGELTDGLGPEMAGWLDRTTWLRDHPGDDDLLGARLRLAPEVLLERAAVSSEEGGWSQIQATVRRWGTPSWEHDVDDIAASLLAGCRGDLPLAELVALLSVAHDLPADALVGATLPAVRELVRHGLLLPVDGWATAAPAGVTTTTGPVG